MESRTLPLLPLSERTEGKINGSKIVRGMWQGIIAEKRATTYFLYEESTPLYVLQGTSYI